MLVGHSDLAFGLIDVLTGTLAGRVSGHVEQPRAPAGPVLGDTVPVVGSPAGNLAEASWTLDGWEVAVARSDTTEFDEFTRAESQRLMKLAYLLTGNVHDAEDLVQESLARVFLDWDRARAADSPHAYTRQVVINANRRRFRHRRPDEAIGADVPEAGQHGGARPHTGEFAVIDDRQQLAHELRKLPPRQRAVVVLRYYEDLSEREVAQVLACSIGTVKSQGSKALAKLRQSADRNSDGAPAPDRLGSRS